MPSTTPVKLIAPVLPAGFCPTDEQSRASAYFGLAQAYLDQIYTTIVISNSVPAVADRGKLWFVPSEGRFYFWDGTSWIADYWHDPFLSAGFSIFFPLDVSQLAFIDNPGGAAATLGSEDRTGPFWKENEDLRARFPLGAGTLQPSASAVAAGATGGKDQTTLTAEQGGTKGHKHAYGLDADNNNDDVFLSEPGASSGNPAPTITIPTTAMKFVPGSAGTGSHIVQNKVVANLITSDVIIAGNVAPDLQPVNLMNPYLVGTWAKRTARKYFSH